MRQELGNEELEMVTGGSVVITNVGRVGFTTLGKKYWLKGVDWKTARDKAEELWENNPQMTDVEFDQYVMGIFSDLGWI